MRSLTVIQFKFMFVSVIKMGAKIWIIIGIVLVSLLAVGGTGYFVYKITQEKPLLGISGYFDENGDPIGGDTQAVVGDVEGVKFLTFKVNAKNKDYVPITFKIIDAYPQKLLDVLPSTEITVNEGEYASWNSGLVDITEYEGTTQEFSVTVLADSPIRQPDNKTAIIEVLINEDPVSAFDVEIVSETNNDADFEPEPDPEVPEETVGNVIFRTTDLSYRGGAIAYSDSCGSELKAFGYSSKPVIGTPQTCESLSSTGDLIMENLIGSTGKSSGSGNIMLWSDRSDPTEVYICEDLASGNPSTSIFYVKYKMSDSDASSVDISSVSVDSSMEVTC